VIRYFFCLTVAMIATLSLGYAQDSRTGGHKGTAEQQRACREDALRPCRGIHDDDAVYACLKTHLATIHSACREVIESGRESAVPETRVPR
jgi:hypothetical protein